MKRWLSLASLAVLAACGAKKEVDLKNASVEEVAKATQNAQKLTPGQWKTTVEIVDVQLTGLPEREAAMAQAMIGGMKGRKNTSEHCLTKEEAEKPPAKMLGADGQCTFEKFQLAGGKVDAKIVCAKPGDPGRMEMTQTGDFGGSRYAIDANMVMSGMGGVGGGKGGMNMKAKVTGERNGKCKKPA